MSLVVDVHPQHSSIPGDKTEQYVTQILSIIDDSFPIDIAINKFLKIYYATNKSQKWKEFVLCFIVCIFLGNEHNAKAYEYISTHHEKNYWMDRLLYYVKMNKNHIYSQFQHYSTHTNINHTILPFVNNITDISRLISDFVAIRHNELLLLVIPIIYTILTYDELLQFISFIIKSNKSDQYAMFQLQQILLQTLFTNYDLKKHKNRKIASIKICQFINECCLFKLWQNCKYFVDLLYDINGYFLCNENDMNIIDLFWFMCMDGSLVLFYSNSSHSSQSSTKHFTDNNIEEYHKNMLFIFDKIVIKYLLNKKNCNKKLLEYVFVSSLQHINYLINDENETILLLNDFVSLFLFYFDTKSMNNNILSFNIWYSDFNYVVSIYVELSDLYNYNNDYQTNITPRAMSAYEDLRNFLHKSYNNYTCYLWLFERIGWSTIVLILIDPFIMFHDYNYTFNLMIDIIMLIIGILISLIIIYGNTIYNVYVAHPWFATMLYLWVQRYYLYTRQLPLNTVSLIYDIGRLFRFYTG